eukprot:m51a1_g2424 Coatomer subunit beta' A (942) ;mRNA; f:812330-815630
MPRLDIKRKLTARSDRVKCVDVHPTEPWVLCSLFNGHVYIWSTQTQSLVKTFEVTDNPVRAAKFIARKQMVITGSDDMYLRVFNYNTMKKLKTIEAHSDYIRSIAVHPTQPYVLSSSDDMSIKLWDWDKNWQNVMIFEGHTHYVMQVVFNPKDPNTFCSASLDRTVKVWGLNSSTPYFTLEGHEKGVNCVDYVADGDKPYLISGADDKTAKVWDYQSKACVATLEGHTHNVSAVLFHPELPIILTGSEDGSVRVWNSGTYRPEKLVNNGMERVWALGGLRGSHLLAVGHDEGVVVLKFGRDEPAVSMDSHGKIVWARHNEVLTGSVRPVSDSSEADASADGESPAPDAGAAPAAPAATRDGDRVALSTKELGRTEIYPKFLRHDPSGRFVAVAGDGEYVIYTALAWRNKSFGPALDFAWGVDSGCYATRENGGKVKIFKNFKEALVLKTNFTAEGLFGGALLGVRSSRFVMFYDWEGRVVRRVETLPKNVFWNDAGDVVVIGTDSSFFVLRYAASEVAAATAAGNVPEDGVETAFEVLHEVAERVRAGQWVGECFVYTNGASKLSYSVGGHVFTLAHLDRHLYLLGYLPRDGRVYLADRRSAGAVVAYRLSAAVVGYQTAILRGDYSAAMALLPKIPEEDRLKIAQFLQARGALEEALAISPDADHRFELACQLSRLEDAIDIARAAPNELKWRALGDLAQKAGRFDLAEECLRAAGDVGGLLLLLSSLGSADKLVALAADARTRGQNNIAFACYLVTRRVDDCLNLLAETGRLPEAAFMARTYAPSRVSELVKQWRADLARVSPRAAEALADPADFPNLFPDMQAAIRAEELLRREYETSVPAAGFADAKATLSRDPVAEIKEAMASESQEADAEEQQPAAEEPAEAAAPQESEPEPASAEPAEAEVAQPQEAAPVAVVEAADAVADAVAGTTDAAETDA